MKPSFIKVTSFYREFLQSYYRAFPGIGTKGFEEQHRHLMDQGYGYADYFPRYLEKNYSIRSMELIHNALPLQQAWAKEHGSDLTGHRLLLQQFRHYRPEIIFLQDSINFDETFLSQVRQEVPSLRLLIGHCCAPFTTDNLRAFSKYDVLLACSERFLDEFQRSGINSYLFPHAFEASHLDETGKAGDRLNETGSAGERLNEIIFIGSLFFRNEFHRTRIAYIEKILEQGLPLHMIGLLEEDPWLRLKLKQSAFVLVRLLEKTGVKAGNIGPYLRKIGQLKEMPQRSRYSPLVKERTRPDLLFGKEMLRTIARYAVGFNLHGEVAGEYAANIRMFEVAGAGTLLVTDHKKNIRSLYEPDREILTFSGREECIEKLTWAIDHPGDTARIAHAGQERTLREHTVEKRVDLLRDILRKEIPGY